MIMKRASGILLHITSLPSNFGIGDLGPWSYRFVDLLSKSRQRYWSILPTTPTSEQYGNSPYQPTSAFAGNTLLLSPELLVKDGLLSEEFVEELKLPFGQVAFEEVTAVKARMIKQVYLNFEKNEKKLLSNDFEGFCSENSSWLNDYALFKALEQSIGKPWYLWPNQLRIRNEQALEQKNDELKELVKREKFAQFIFSRQWRHLKDYCQMRNVRIFGDLPFYMSYDNADVWSHPEMFKLDSEKRPKFISGVPPDYFSKEGQLWGNPIYDWQELKKIGFQWWIERIRLNLTRCDILRFDHFRGFTAYWQIPATSKTAKEGQWIRSPSKSFFRTLKKAFPNNPFVAEDLGFITDRVKKHLMFLDIPGMRVLLFGFDGSDDNPNLPVNISKNSVVYTGTHDTNTTKGWFNEEATYEEKERLFRCMNKEVLESQISYEFIKLALKSRANLAIIAMQDLLSLSSQARMNHPARFFHNWEWRIESEKMEDNNFDEFKTLTENSGR